MFRAEESVAADMRNCNWKHPSGCSIVDSDGSC